MHEVFSCADRAGKYEMINFIEAQIKAGLIHPRGDWPSEIWNVLWDIADRIYIPHHLKKVLDLTSRQTFSYQTELVQTVGIKYENITKQKHFGILIALVAKNLENLVANCQQLELPQVRDTIYEALDNMDDQQWWNGTLEDILLPTFGP